MRKSIGTGSVFCTVGGAVFAIAVESDHISKIIDIPEVGYKAMLIIGGLLVLLGLTAITVSVLRSRTSRLLDFVSKKRGHKYILVYASYPDLPQLHSFYQEFFEDDVPSLDLMRTWVRKYRKAFAMVYRVNDISIKKKQQVLAGSYKVLLVTEEAVRGLEAEDLCGSTFKAEHVASRQKDAAAYYIGDVIATTRLARGFILASLNVACEHAFRRGLPIYARPLTSDGLRVMTQYGFVQVHDENSPPEMEKMCKLTTGGDGDKSRRVKKTSKTRKRQRANKLRLSVP